MAEELLHDQILRHAFLADTDRPAQLTTEDLFWKLQDPQLSLPKIKECLEWLVGRGDMAVDRSKFGLSKTKFFELKKQFAHLGPKGIPIWLAPIAPIHIPVLPKQVLLTQQEMAQEVASSTPKTSPATEPSAQNVETFGLSEVHNKEIRSEETPILSQQPTSAEVPSHSTAAEESSLQKTTFLLQISAKQVNSFYFLLLLQGLLIAFFGIAICFSESNHQRYVFFAQLFLSAITSLSILCLFQILRRSPIVQPQLKEK